MQQHLDYLGWAVEDKVTGYKGVVTHVGVDLFGCVQGIVLPRVTTETNGTQKVEDSRWFDLSRLIKHGDRPVMEPVPLKGDQIVAGGAHDHPIK